MPDLVLRFSRGLWNGCMAELQRRGRRRHESGCFVLGTDDGYRRWAARCVYYDELDPGAYASGVCVLDGSAFPRLWEICRAAGLTVVADIHTHPGAAFQSESDRCNPMIARPGHLAVIVPRFAGGPIWRHRLGLFRYEGDHRWTDLSGWRARRFLKIAWSWR
jgi:proteasome lid subunit RPN8/RPN11